ncbi:hypothetical protein G97194_001922, partial [Escherichia coli]
LSHHEYDLLWHILSSIRRLFLLQTHRYFHELILKIVGRPA